MNAAGLVQLAAARGIDLQYVAGVASDLQGPAAERTLTRDERKRGIREVALTVKGKASRAYRRPDWSVAELGQAAQGLGPIPWAAALYSLAGARDGQTHMVLWSALSLEAQRLGRRERWPMRVPGFDGELKYYREQLAGLVLDVDANRALFLAAGNALHATYMDVKIETYEQQLKGPYRSLEDVFNRWLAIAQGAIAKWIRGED